VDTPSIIARWRGQSGKKMGQVCRRRGRPEMSRPLPSAKPDTSRRLPRRYRFAPSLVLPM